MKVILTTQSSPKFHVHTVVEFAGERLVDPFCSKCGLKENVKDPNYRKPCSG